MQATECLREDILDHVSDERKPPESLESFLRQLLMNRDHPNRDTANRLIQSYSSDLIHGV
jgi:hypothetical protein